MRNITNDTPFKTLIGRTRYTTEKFIDSEDFEYKEILDIGCGYGWFENYIINNSNPKKIFASEVTEKDLETIKKYLDNSKIENIVSSAIDIKLSNESVNTIVAWEVIEHIPAKTENKMFQEAQRVLKKDGVFYLSKPYDHFVSKFLDPAWWLIEHRHYSYKQLENFANHNGFIIEKFEIKGGIWALLSLLNMYIAKWIFHKNRFFCNLFEKNDDDEFMSPKRGYSNIFVKYREI